MSEDLEATVVALNDLLRGHMVATGRLFRFLVKSGAISHEEARSFLLEGLEQVETGLRDKLPEERLQNVLAPYRGLLLAITPEQIEGADDLKDFIFSRKGPGH